MTIKTWVELGMTGFGTWSITLEILVYHHENKFLQCILIKEGEVKRKVAISGTPERSALSDVVVGVPEIATPQIFHQSHILLLTPY